jgi:hypothetical protein
MLPAFLKFHVASGDRSCFIFSNQDGLFVISCSLACHRLLLATLVVGVLHRSRGDGKLPTARLK